MTTNDESLDALINSEAWPIAVPVSMVINSPHDEQVRARSIINNMLPDLTDKTFLDFGCGSGQVVALAKEKASRAVGYDPATCWDGDIPYLESVLSPFQYDVILLYDVIDHASDSVMDIIQMLCHRNTTIRVRTHPFTSIHGGHQYYKYNKAYVHYFLPYNTIHNEFGPLRACDVFDPRVKYNRLFKNFTIEKVDEHRMVVPDFFTSNEMLERIRRRFNLTGISDSEIIDVMSIQFIDYILNSQPNIL